MMKIRRGKQRSFPQAKSGEMSKSAAGVSVRHTPFLQALQESIYERDEDSLARTFAAIDEAAQALRCSATWRNLKIYKDLVRSFLRIVIGHSYQAHQEMGFDRYGHRRVYLIIRQIDKELDELTREVMHAQASNLALVSRLDEIRGLLLDLYS